MVGVYEIINKSNNKTYVGSSVNIGLRWREHKRALDASIHHSSHLQRAWKAYGEELFIFRILEECPKEIVLEREQHWINLRRSYDREFGYNICQFVTQSRLGLKASPETLKRMSIANGGENHPNWGRKLSSSHVENIKRAGKGIKKPTSGKRKVYEVLSPSGQAIKFSGLRSFCRANNLQLTSFFLLLSGRKNEYLGWKRIDYEEKSS